MRNNTYTANQDIRDYMADHGVSQRVLSYQMGINISVLNRKLKTELSQKEKEELLHHIDAIAADRMSGEAEEAEQTEESAEVQELTEDTEETTAEDVSCGAKFQVGDRVKIPSKSLCIGTISDIWHSLVQDKMMYAVVIDGGNMALYREDQLEPAPLPIEYTFNATVEDNVAVVCMIAHQGDTTWVHARGHAHILHDGAVGIAQAVSYASKRMFESLDTQRDNRIFSKNGGKK